MQYARNMFVSQRQSRTCQSLLGKHGTYFYTLGFCATDPNVKGSRTEAYADMINRDRRRWEKADRDKDGRLSKEEFMDFLHPEDTEHMRDIVVMVSIMHSLCVCVGKALL